MVSSSNLVALGVPDLEFDGVSKVLPWLDSFNENCFAFGKLLLWRSAILLTSDGAASSSGEGVIFPFSLG
jgi:hypothetical protein